MLAFETALAAFLQAQPIAGLVSGGFRSAMIVQDRNEAPVYPCVVYTKISTNPEVTHSGPSNVEQARYQFDIDAVDPVVARQIADGISLALHGFAGTMAGSAGTVEIGGAFLEDEDSGYIDEFEVHRVRQDYMVWFGA